MEMFSRVFGLFKSQSEVPAATQDLSRTRCKLEVRANQTERPQLPEISVGESGIDNDM